MHSLSPTLLNKFRCLTLSGALFFLLSVALAAEDLAQRLDAETRLPAYLNRSQATLVLLRHDASETLNLIIDFEERDTGWVPASPLAVVLTGPNHYHQETIAIEDWPDGDYRVRIAEVAGTGDPLIRAIRKQTQKLPMALEAPIAVAGQKMFFVDDWYVAQESGIRRTVQPAELHPIDPWEVAPDLQFYNSNARQFWRAEDGFFYVQISALNRTGDDPLLYWLRSPDMEQWERVESPAPAVADWKVHHLRQQEPAALETSEIPANPLYRPYDPELDGTVDLAEVVVKYTGFAQNQKWGDVDIPARARIALWLRPNNEVLILGDPITIDKLAWERDEIGSWGDSNDNFGGPKMSADGSQLRVFQTRRIPRHDPYRVHYDNILADRILVTWTTEDGLHWKPTFFDVPTKDDPWSTQHYGVDTWWEEGNALELAYHRIYDCQRQQVKVELAYSRDGTYWQRFPDAPPVFENGPRGTWNFGYAITPPSGIRTRMEWDGHYYDPMVGINVLHFMFLQAHNRENRDDITVELFSNLFGGRMMGENGVENSPIMHWYTDWEDIAQHTREQRFVPGLAKFRKDGWVAAEPLDEEGEIITQPLLAGDAIAINARTQSGGFVRVEILDIHGNPLSEYSGVHAALFQGDAIGESLSWKHRSLPAGPVRLRITLNRAELFTLEFSHRTRFADTFLNSKDTSVAFDGHRSTGNAQISGTWNSSAGILLAGGDDPSYGADGLLYLSNGTTGGAAYFHLDQDAITPGDIIKLRFTVERLDREDYRDGWLGIGFSNSTNNLATEGSGPWIRMQEDGSGLLYGGGGTGNSISLNSHFGSETFTHQGGFTTIALTLDTGTLDFFLDNGSPDGSLSGTLTPTHAPNFEYLQLRWFGHTTAPSYLRVQSIELERVILPRFTFHLEHSTDLNNWEPLRVFPKAALNNGGFALEFPQMPPAGFFRLRKEYITLGSE